MVFRLSQSHSSGALQVNASPCSLRASGHAVASWCEMLLVGILCSSFCFPAPAECSTVARSLCDQGRIGRVPPKRKIVPLLSAVVCVIKKKKRQLISASDIIVV